MVVRIYKKLFTIPLCLSLIVTVLGIYPSITPHILILGMVGFSSSVLSMKFDKFFKPLTLATSILYLVVFLWISTIPGNIMTAFLSYVALLFTVLSIISLLVVKEV
ncbi:hypothetical protein KEJ27_00030 [Candidatus Bathyarchaeota archaeon]|nr:hypothetical protein [Candidatus Bathyarchaeota archaeon]MBS7614097.1 hypothetical protein [Candidatus Bathyarchaeota archaeon]MBS7618687.1 hypothetical protein [Candidatus Bathyarchaeota archaeon]